MTNPNILHDPFQIKEFKEAGRELECDDDDARFDERVKRLVKRKPKPEKSV